MLCITCFIINIFLCPIVVHSTLANSAFEDDNFYQCVVKAYNSTNGASLSVSSNLTDDQLQTIINLDCHSKNISDVSGIKKMTSLTSLDLSDASIIEGGSYYYYHNSFLKDFATYGIIDGVFIIILLISLFKDLIPSKIPEITL